MQKEKKVKLMDVLRVFETLRNPTKELNLNTTGLNFEPSIMQISLMHEEYIRTGYDKHPFLWIFS